MRLPRQVAPPQQLHPIVWCRVRPRSDGSPSGASQVEALRWDRLLGEIAAANLDSRMAILDFSGQLLKFHACNDLHIRMAPLNFIKIDCADATPP